MNKDASLKKRLLIIDDDPELLEMIKFLCESRKYEVLTAEDGMEGLTIIDNLPPDIIILDILMPNLDGVSFVNELKKKEATRQIPIVIISGRKVLDDSLIMKGIKHYLQKPFEAEELLQVVEDILYPPITES